MELRHLRYFVAVIEEGNFGRAAKRCFVAQPTLSQQIKTLEGELGAELVTRSRLGTEATAIGEVLLPFARRILAEADRAEAAVANARDGKAGTLRIGYEAAVLRDGMVEPIRSFRESVPDVTLDFWEGGSAEQAEAVRTGRSDLALLLLPVDAHGLEVRSLRAAAVTAVLPIIHRLAGRSTVALAELADEGHISWARDPAPGVYDDFVKACATAGFIPRIVQHVTNVESMLALVAAGVGVGCMHAARVQREYPGVVYAELVDPRLTIETGVAWRKGDDSPLLKRFLEALDLASLRGT